MPDGLECISINSMGKIVKGVNKTSFTKLYGSYCYIIRENFPQKFSPCTGFVCCCIDFVLLILSYFSAAFLSMVGFGASTSQNEGGFLRVSNAFPTRRLSDNTLMTPKIHIASSCVSSPGGTPSGGLPIRRHSSTGPQERRGSNINLSPPTVILQVRFKKRLFNHNQSS